MRLYVELDEEGNIIGITHPNFNIERDGGVTRRQRIFDCYGDEYGYWSVLEERLDYIARNWGDLNAVQIYVVDIPRTERTEEAQRAVEFFSNTSNISSDMKTAHYLDALEEVIKEALKTK